MTNGAKPHKEEPKATPKAPASKTGDQAKASQKKK